MFRARNPGVQVFLTATWSRPDQTFPPQGAWVGQPIEKMALDIRRADDEARQVSGAKRVLPVGQAFNCAIALGIADSNPYDGITRGKIHLWADDHYHASTAGYYLEALTIFAGVAMRDPRRLGAHESAGAELGLPPALVDRLEGVANAMALRGHC
jgi:hypothetical protein